jgi:hypothetical protein
MWAELQWPIICRSSSIVRFCSGSEQITLDCAFVPSFDSGCDSIGDEAMVSGMSVGVFQFMGCVLIATCEMLSGIGLS